MSTSTMPKARCAMKTNTHGPRSHCKVKAVAASARDTICSKGSKKDYYKVLSLEHPAAVGAEEIKRAYRRLALCYHPDVCPPSRRAQSTELFVELRRAYETLSDPAQRVRYDAEMRATGEDGAAARPGGGVEFPRDVWEAQLCELRARSEQRQRARRGGVPIRRQPV
ncbi:hypothetical protein SETIT_2G187800v2 [Setaria italica]|uniref:J domain-containing protein n=2 Tax=Setaria italica TaxID=4555 RepID=A0A368Q0A8_SETIT|nr:hypothetical protein SETIT_2G187800v2 [Setaria italica]